VILRNDVRGEFARWDDGDPRMPAARLIGALGVSMVYDG